MANVLDQLTIGQKKIIIVDSDPTTGGGVAGANIGDIIIVDDPAGVQSGLYVKSTAAATGSDKSASTDNSIVNALIFG